MAEVLDQETLANRPPSDEECFAYEPPPAFVGMQVAFWRDGKPSAGKRPESAFITAVPQARKTVTVWLLGVGHQIANVRHVSDPRLVRHTNLRDQGVWDYTEHDSQLAERFAALEKRLTALEEKSGKFKGKAAE